MNILVGITGSSSAKVSHKLVDKLVEEGHAVIAVVTEWGKKLQESEVERERIVSAVSTRMECPKLKNAQMVYDDKSEHDSWMCHGKVLHVDLARWADVMVIAPCTSNTLAKIICGISDNLLTSIVRVFDKKLYIAPAMNTDMFKKAYFKGWFSSLHYEVIYPTTKMLTCGEFGMGAMADVGDVANIVTGHRWENEHNVSINDLAHGVSSNGFSPANFPHPGWFGSVRRHDIHAGFDLYCRELKSVYSFEDGEVVSIGDFTGEEVGSPWWYRTQYVSVKGKSGIIVYGEIGVHEELKVGQKIGTRHYLGHVKRVLKKEPKEFISLHKMDMLHIELLTHDAPVNFIEEWKHGEDRPTYLKDPSAYLGLT
jgi:phosphopantothenoylcysteine decarboxylase